MNNDETKKILLADIEYFRRKGEFYHSLRLFEAEKYANSLASNIELALTTMSFDDGMETA